MVNRTFVYIALGLLVFFLLSWLFSNILAYLVISIVISSILRPLTNYISNVQLFKIRIPRVIAVLFSFAIFIAVISLFVILFIPLISEQVEILSGVEFNALVENVRAPFDWLEDQLVQYKLAEGKKGFMVEQLGESVRMLISEIEIGDLLNNIISFTGNFFIGLLAVSFISFFMLYEMGSMRKKIISLIPNKYFEISIAAFNKIERLFSNYLIGLLFQMFSVFSIASLGLGIFGINYALTIAVFAALANLIPYLGPILGATFGILVGVSTGTGLMLVNDYLILILKIVSVFVTVQLIDNLFLQPLIFSKSVKAHPLEIFIIIFAGATIGRGVAGGVGGGILGMIAAIPVYTIIRVSVIELYTGYKKYSILKL